MPELKDVDVSASKVDAHPEALDVAVSDDVLAFFVSQGIDVPRGDVRHGATRPINRYPVPYRYLDSDIRGEFWRDHGTRETIITLIYRLISLSCLVAA